MAEERKKIRFLIDHIDPLGQGVFKNAGDIYFIPKTLPGEKGEALILKSKKNIHFCRLSKLDHSSPLRTPAPCPHFDECPGCHFLHTNYEEELKFKAQSFARMLAPIGSPEFSIESATERLGYRNRIQLHYKKKSQKIGFIQGKENRVLEIPQCKIFREELRPRFNDVVANWNKKAKTEKAPQGHVELYLSKNGEVVETWNKRYANSGFTQVNEEMNRALLSALERALGNLNIKSVLDLFGGDGNLASFLQGRARVDHIDIYGEANKAKDNFFSLDLMKESSLEEFADGRDLKTYDLFLVDPPRAGFKLLNEWVEAFSPKFIAYVSCHPPTMIRDLKNIKRPYQALEVKMLDLFPSTFHFEAVTILKME